MLRTMVAGLVGAILGATAAIGYFVWRDRQPVDDEWRVATLKRPTDWAFYTSDIIGADLPPPDIISVTVKGKFLEELGKPDLVRFGFVVELQTKPLAKADIPAKYLKAEDIKIGHNVLKGMPLEQATYTARVSFKFLDADRFELASLDSEDFYVESGTDKVIQAKLPSPMGVDIARRVRSIVAAPHLIKCVTCR